MNTNLLKVNILTGFFGSGKTTLISNMIKNESIKNNVAIIQNEFSEEMGIERDVLTDSEGNSLGDLYELPSGCLCCVVKDNIIIFIENLIKKKDNINLVIIEAHGLSDIGILLKKFWLDKELESPIKLNSIICIIDCLNFEKNLKSYEEVMINQIISADKIILNKTDLIKSLDCLSDIKCFINNLNPLVEIYITNYANIELNNFLKSTVDNIKLINDDHIHHFEEHKIENLIIKIEKPANIEILDKSIGRILWDLSEKYNFEIIRFKGIINIENKNYNLQGLYDLYEFEEIKNSSNTESKILFIGKNIRKFKIEIEKALNN